jgi:hypothetical protein
VTGKIDMVKIQLYMKVLMNITDLTPQEWNQRLSEAPANGMIGPDGSLTPQIDHWLRSLCQPFIHRIEEANADIWHQCQHINLTPINLAQQLSSIPSLQQSGVVLLVAGDDGLSSLIRAATTSRFSHVGYLLPSPNPNEGPILWQSYAHTPTKANYPYDPAFVPGQITRWGADCSDLARYLLDYQRKEPHARFIIRPLRSPLSPVEQAKIWHTIDQTLARQVIYPTSLHLTLLFLRNRFPTLRPLCDYLLGPGPIDQGGEFCSMLVAHTEAETGLLELDPIKRDIEGYLPGDFSLDLGHLQPQDLRDHQILYGPTEIELHIHPT